MGHPYQTLPARAFWRSAVADADRTQFPGLYQPKVTVTRQTAVATAGSCFAQHIGRTLRQAGITVLDAEPAPRAMPPAVAESFGYGLFSGRYGNVYTARQMRQLLEDVISGDTLPDHVWTRDGRFFDAFRPTVEPDGIDTVDEVLLHRAYHLERTARMLCLADVFIFTLGLTEAWEDRTTGRVFPVCPGVVAGTFDPARHVLRNFRHAEVYDDLTAILALLRRFNPAMQLILTVSPVPLTATAAGDHVLNATSWSKATLRAAAGDFVTDTPGTDYVPSFEIITHPASGGPFFAPNLRSVTPEGVAKVMGIFLAAQGLTALPPAAVTPAQTDADDDADDVVCDELLLQAFATCPDPSA